MNLKSFLRYAIRFLTLQTILTYFTNFYFNRFLMNEYLDGYLVIINNLIEDRDRFYPIINNNFIKIDIYIAIFIFIFLIILYSTKFFTYVNELTFAIDKKFFDEYLNIYLVWTSSLMAFLFLFRFSVVSRFYLVLLTFIVPVILQTFRNTEIISNLLGKSLTNEKFITFNLRPDSIFRKLRIMTFRKNLADITIDTLDSEKIINNIDSLNKQNEVNLIVINFENQKIIDIKLEEYLINLNKKILILSNSKLEFNSLFINQTKNLNGSFLTYFNNDIQYGSKYIIKRLIDLFLSILALFIFLPLLIAISLIILINNGSPILIKQDRVGLHGKDFKMYKFRTMYKNSHEKRNELNNLNKNDKVIFKIKNDPRIFKGGKFLRKYSLDELPQLFNVIKGEMSLVGPRPLFKEDTLLFDENYMRRLNVLPGLTGLLQINERNTDKFEVWFKYDIEYINNWSIYLDVFILLKTPLSIFKRSSKGL